MLRIGRCRVHHRLLILWTKEWQPFLTAAFDYALPQTGDVAMTKNAPDRTDESVLQTISLDELASHESNNGLPNG
jgi:hypothetical protein